jgi:hypothetical protein
MVAPNYGQADRINPHVICPQYLTMESEFVLKFHGDFIEIVHPPGFVASPSSMPEIWRIISEACSRFDCRKVLVVARQFKRELDTAQAFDSGVEASRIVPGISLALCLTDYEPDDLSVFFKTVALNRGTTVEFFNGEDKAREWLNTRPAE